MPWKYILQYKKAEITFTAFYELPFLKTSKWRNQKAYINIELNIHMTVLVFALRSVCLDCGQWNHLSFWWWWFPFAFLFFSALPIIQRWSSGLWEGGEELELETLSLCNICRSACICEGERRWGRWKTFPADWIYG